MISVYLASLIVVGSGKKDDVAVAAVMRRAGRLICDQNAANRDIKVRHDFNLLLKLEDSTLIPALERLLKDDEGRMKGLFPKITSASAKDSAQLRAAADSGWLDTVAVYTFNRFAYQIPMQGGKSSSAKLPFANYFSNRPIWPWTETPGGHLRLTSEAPTSSIPFPGNPLAELRWLRRHGHRRLSRAR